jgi:hypothetical protein
MTLFFISGRFALLEESGSSNVDPTAPTQAI